MAPGRTSGFHRQGDDWFSSSSLQSDITVVVDEVKFHLHKFPLISRCGKIATICEESESSTERTLQVRLEEFPGGADTFFIVVKFCYGGRLEFTPKNIVILYCAADYLSMTDVYGEDNLLSKSKSYFHKHILKDWKDCILALQSCELVIPRADKLQIISKCINALSVMICTDPSLFGWPMMMYGSLQSPGGSILWNGINTGAKIHSNESDWWFEDVSYLCVELFERLIQTLEAKGISPENLARAIMYYCKKYLPGLGRRWQGGQSSLSRTVTSFSMMPANVNQVALLQSVIKLLPEKKGKSFCRFLLGLLRVSLILGVNNTCRDSLERRIGVQLDLATLDGLLIPNYSDSDTLYNTDCVERMIRHFVSLESSVASISPLSTDPETSTLSVSFKRVAKLVDNYAAEVASDVNLKPGKLRGLAEALPESSRSLHDGLYRALDIYFKAHPWLSDKEREQLCNIIDFQKLSIDACAHASQNERLPLRVVLQVLFFEQMQLRTALAGCLNALDAESAPTASLAVPNEAAGPRVRQDGWVTVVHENQMLKVDMERMRSRVGELEEEFSKIKEEMKKATGCNLLPQASDAQKDVVESGTPTPRASVEQAQPSLQNPRHRKSSSLF
ncbi:hypothetical protein SASPL_104377 [Salvia splendens]|uniref:Uncharacterized protein n=1 Tax=Salvia splendens TaxID=180675 RepID=A0A8X8YJC0_SALSN|nr:BTB/POZ domain-containing protein At3g44820-like [Salvia splendens]KAG6432790.1 hypothetical protein SASPL_104377 [Salvia splendens]